jgi:hypothetical protein
VLAPSPSPHSFCTPFLPACILLVVPRALPAPERSLCVTIDYIVTKYSIPASGLSLIHLSPIIVCCSTWQKINTVFCLVMLLQSDLSRFLHSEARAVSARQLVLRAALSSNLCLGEPTRGLRKAASLDCFLLHVSLLSDALPIKFQVSAVCAIRSMKLLIILTSVSFEAIRFHAKVEGRK